MKKRHLYFIILNHIFCNWLCILFIYFYKRSVLKKKVTHFWNNRKGVASPTRNPRAQNKLKPILYSREVRMKFS